MPDGFDLRVVRSIITAMKQRFLTALPVYNEERHVAEVLSEVLQHVTDVLVVDDGSTDGTAEILRREFPSVHVQTHAGNLGYGAALRTAFSFAVREQYNLLVTMDCDGQHQPSFLNTIAELIDSPAAPVDMVSGSRYLKAFFDNSIPPKERRAINSQITECLNQKLGLCITDAFCGFKAYRVSSLSELDITENGYAMPLQLWVQAVDLRWKISEFPVPLLYLDANRSFGGSLDDAAVRLSHYMSVLNNELQRRGMTQRFTVDCGSESAGNAAEGNAETADGEQLQAAAEYTSRRIQNSTNNDTE
jgi:glycosyltransferase involved in cell wall biosynthesis